MEGGSDSSGSLVSPGRRPRKRSRCLMIMEDDSSDEGELGIARKVSSNSENSYSSRCPICLLDFAGEVASPGACPHSFCLECLLSWSQVRKRDLHACSEKQNTPPSACSCPTTSNARLPRVLWCLWHLHACMRMLLCSKSRGTLLCKHLICNTLQEEYMRTRVWNSGSTVNPEYFVCTHFSYPGLSDLSYA